MTIVTGNKSLVKSPISATIQSMEAATDMTNGHLRTFVMEQMAQRELGLRKFGELCGVSHSTLSRILNEPDSYQPTFTIVSRLAKGTGTDIRELAAMLAPDAVLGGGNADTILRALRIAQLPEESQRLLDSFLKGEILQHRKK